MLTNIKLSSHKFGAAIKHSLLIICIALLSSCGEQVEDVTIATTKTSNQSMVVGNSNESKLLTSLAATYPNGQLPDSLKAQAGIALAQNPAALLLTAETPEQYYSQSTLTTIHPQAAAADFQPVQRIQNASLYGAYFFSIYPSEVSSALSTHPNWRLEGPAFWASLATGTGLYPVHRFQNKLNGSYLYTIYDTERADIVANYAATFAYEGVAWYAQQTPGTGWSPLYRFRNKTNGTYLFSAYESEKDAIVANYPDVFALEGIGYYVRQDAPVEAPVLPPVVPVIPPVVPPIVSSPTVTSISPTAATLGQATTFTVIGTNLPLTAILSVQDAVCLVPTGNTATGFSQICASSGTLGAKTITVKTASGGTVINASRIVNVSALVPSQPLNDTGITSSQCYQANSDTLVSCTSPGAQALNNKQDGMTGRDVAAPSTADGKLGFSFSLVGTFSITDCVKDNVTGLVWEGKPTTGIRASGNTYTDTNINSPAAAYVATVNNSNLCGFSDWRLPSADELQGLVDYSISSPALMIDSVWFPNTILSTTNSNLYLTSAPTTGMSAYYLDLYFSFAQGLLIGGTSQMLGPIRLVRGVKPAANGPYTYSPDGSEVTDLSTGLIWRRCTEGQTWNGSTCAGTALTFTHQGALSHANSQAGWRVPNIKELKSYRIRDSVNNTIDKVAFPNEPVPCPSTGAGGYWSSTPYISDPSFAWAQNPCLPTYKVSGKPRSQNGNFVRLVR